MPRSARTVRDKPNDLERTRHCRSAWFKKNHPSTVCLNAVENHISVPPTRAHDIGPSPSSDTKENRRCPEFSGICDSPTYVGRDHSTRPQAEFSGRCNPSSFRRGGVSLASAPGDSANPGPALSSMGSSATIARCSGAEQCPAETAQFGHRRPQVRIGRRDERRHPAHDIRLKSEGSRGLDEAGGNFSKYPYNLDQDRSYDCNIVRPTDCLKNRAQRRAIA